LKAESGRTLKLTKVASRSMITLHQAKTSACKSLCKI
jgi:hypothetical protein